MACEYVRPDLNKLASVVADDANVFAIQEQLKRPNSVDTLSAHAWLVIDQVSVFTQMVKEMYGARWEAQLRRYVSADYLFAVFDEVSRETCIIKNFSSSWVSLPGSEMKRQIPGVFKGALFLVPVPS